jgi:soluble lytic murein transglycosylase-like protein
LAQQPAEIQEKARSAMDVSVARQATTIEQQRDSIRKQAPAGAVEHSFFLTPWVDPAPAPARGAETAAVCEPVPKTDLDLMIKEAARRESLTPDLLRAVIRKESAFQPCAVSEKGALGLMQLMPATAARFGVDDPFDPRQNIDAGTKFLGELLKRYGNDLSLALSAYNAGPARVDAKGGIPSIPETVAYVSGILDTLR